MSDAQSARDNYQGVWGQRIGFGRKAALLMIDFMQGYTTPGAPLYAPGVVSACWRWRVTAVLWWSTPISATSPRTLPMVACGCARRR